MDYDRSLIPPFDRTETDYITPPGRGRPFDMAWPEGSFIWNACNVVATASKQARNGTMNLEQWHQAAWGITHCVERVGGRVVVEGTRHVRDVGGPCVIVGNHMSTLETMSTCGFVSPIIYPCFVVKDSLLRYPVFKHMMRWTNPVAVGRKDPRADFKTVMEEGQKRLEAGRAVIIFPQTTRKEFFDPSTFNSIGAKLARRAKVPVVPLAVKTDVWGNGKLIKDVGPIRPERTARFAFGEPMTIEGTERAAQKATVDFISSKLRSWSPPTV